MTDATTTQRLASLPTGGIAVVIGASGGIGGAFVEQLERGNSFVRTVGLGRSSVPAVDLGSEDSIAAAAEHVAGLDHPVRLVVVATGFLHDEAFQPEKTWRQLDSGHLLQAFAVNAIGPALVMKHFLPLLPRRGKSVFAALSAKVGSISDNRLGGWYSYRASKAALNQLVRTASTELRRTHPEAVLVSLHPGTVDTRLSAPFAKSGLDVRSPSEAARHLLAVVDGLAAEDSGGFVDYRGQPVPW